MLRLRKRKEILIAIEALTTKNCLGLFIHFLQPSSLRSITLQRQPFLHQRIRVNRFLCDPNSSNRIRISAALCIVQLIGKLKNAFGSILVHLHELFPTCQRATLSFKAVSGKSCREVLGQIIFSQLLLCPGCPRFLRCFLCSGIRGHRKPHRQRISGSISFRIQQRSSKLHSCKRSFHCLILRIQRHNRSHVASLHSCCIRLLCRSCSLKLLLGRKPTTESLVNLSLKLHLTLEACILCVVSTNLFRHGERIGNPLKRIVSETNLHLANNRSPLLIQLSFLRSNLCRLLTHEINKIGSSMRANHSSLHALTLCISCQLARTFGFNCSNLCFTDLLRSISLALHDVNHLTSNVIHITDLISCSGSASSTLRKSCFVERSKAKSHHSLLSPVTPCTYWSIKR